MWIFLNVLISENITLRRHTKKTPGDKITTQSKILSYIKCKAENPIPTIAQIVILSIYSTPRG